MWIKICANTNLEDALLACELGADALGFVFAPSKRQVTAQQVASITPHLPPSVEKVGVFTSSDYDEIRRTADIAGLTTIQLHGAVNLKLAEELAARPGEGLEVIQVVHWSVDTAQAPMEVAARLKDANEHCHAFTRILIDAKVGNASGGLGTAFDWTQAREVFSSYPRLRLILAGGLTPDNVGEAIRELKPWGVDVASGVESTPGRKDAGRLRRFIAAARGEPVEA